jgi:uncharacterized surface protein with fasciclin (FAS1) repeats
VVSGKAMSGDVVKLSSVKTVDGRGIAIKTIDGGVMVNDARVVHVVDMVLLPE